MTEHPAERAEDRGSRILTNPFVWAFFAGVVILILIRPLLRFEPAPPPPLWALPRYSLTDQNGHPFGSEDLRGHVYVASFFFTRCPSVCPAVMGAMSRLQEQLAKGEMDRVRLVSISVDPAEDTPLRLEEYGHRFGQDPARWALLTGDPETVRKLLFEGFKVPLGDRRELGGGLYDIAHTAKLALVDGQGRVRGFYDATDRGLDEAFHRARRVLKEEGG